MSAPLTRRRALAVAGALAGAGALALVGRAAARAADEAAYRAWAARMAGALRWLRRPYTDWFDVEPEGWDGWLSSAPDHPFPRLALTAAQRAWLAEAAAAFDDDPREPLSVEPAEAVGRLGRDLEAVVSADPGEDATLALWAWGGALRRLGRGGRLRPGGPGDGGARRFRLELVRLLQQGSLRPQRLEEPVRPGSRPRESAMTAAPLT